MNSNERNNLLDKIRADLKLLLAESRRDEEREAIEEAIEDLEGLYIEGDLI